MSASLVGSGLAHQAAPLTAAAATAPADWRWARLKFLADINRSALPETTDPDYEFRYIDISSVTLGQINGTTQVRFGTAPSRARRIVRRGDIIVSTVRTYLKAIARVGEDDQDLVCSTGFAVVTPRAEVDPDYLYFWLVARPFVEEISARSTGVSYPAVTSTEVGDIACPVPPLALQRQIAAEIAAEVGEIDAIEVTRARFVRLLAERRRRATIDAVTGGSPADGVRLGDVSFPADWKRLRIKNLVSSFVGGEWGDEPLTDSAVKCYRGADFDRTRLEVLYEKAPERSITPERLSRVGLEPGDVIIEKSGGGEQQPVGAVVMYDREEPAVCANFCARVRPSSLITPRYLLHVLNGIYTSGLITKFILQTTGIQNLDAEALLEHPWAIPPREEQDEVCSRLDVELDRLHGLLSAVDREAHLLKDRRDAVVTINALAAHTGAAA